MLLAQQILGQLLRTNMVRTRDSFGWIARVRAGLGPSSVWTDLNGVVLRTAVLTCFLPHTYLPYYSYQGKGGGSLFL